MKKITYLLIAIVLSSCQKEDTDGIPTYLKINNINFDEGNTTSNITDAWVYINGRFLGVYELPAKFPILEHGNTDIKVYAGIKINGIASDRAIYPFYLADTLNKMLAINSTTEIAPSVNIKGNIDGQYDDFDLEGYSFNFDSRFQVLTNGPYGNYG